MSNSKKKIFPFVYCIICVAPDSENQNQPMNLSRALIKTHQTPP